MLDKMRGVLAPSLETLGRVFAKTGLSPNVWTAIGLILSLAAAIVYLIWALACSCDYT